MVLSEKLRHTCGVHSGLEGEIPLKGYYLLSSFLLERCCWPALPLYLPEAKVKIAAQCPASSAPQI